MGIFDFLFGKAKDKIANDFWGELTFFEGGSLKKGGSFNAKKYFTPVSNSIDVWLAAGNSGPTSQQIDFYKLIEEQYTDVVQAITPVLEDEFGNWQEDFKIKDFEQEFSMLSINLPDCTGKPVEWEIAFSSIHDDEHMFTVIMHDFKAQHVQIDG